MYYPRLSLPYYTTGLQDKRKYLDSNGGQLIAMWDTPDYVECNLDFMGDIDNKTHSLSLACFRFKLCANCSANQLLETSRRFIFLTGQVN